MNPDLSPEELEALRKILAKNEGEQPPKEAEVKPQKPAKSKRNTPAAPRKAWYRNKVILSLLAVVVTMGLAAVYVFAIEPAIALKQAENALNEQKARSAVVAGNSEFISYEPENEEHRLSGANPKQLALGEDGKITPPAYFEFRSENSTKDSHVLDLYIDFYSQRARDLISLNQGAFSSFIGSGDIILRVHPVVQTDGFSVFAPEALAEVFGTHPKQAWPFFVSLMKNSDELLDNSNTEEAKNPTPQETIAFIAKISANEGISTGSPDGVDADSIKYLTFFSWLYGGSEDEKLEVGYYPPVLYIDGKEVDQEKWILTDPDSMLKLLAGLS